MSVIGSYANGFAPRDGQPLYPELWRGCVGAWAPCLGPTGLTLRDWSGFGRHGTLVNQSSSGGWINSQGRPALYFSASNHHVDCGDISALDFGTQPFAIGFWINMPPRTASWAALAKDDWDSGASGLLFYGAISDANTLLYWSGAARSFGAILDSAWHHVGISRASTAANATSLYVDGKLLSTFTDARNLTNSRPFRIGNDADADKGIIGSVEDIIVYAESKPASVFRTLSARRGIAYELAPRRRGIIFTGGSGFRAYWAARKAQILGGGL